jgi:RNA polymerase sigma-70 factor, ECF subfamily
MAGQGRNAEFRDVFERCQGRYPTIRLPFELFSARLERILHGHHESHTGTPASDFSAGEPSCPTCQAVFRQLCHEDLYLALACAHGDRVAWEFFADQYLPLLKRFAMQACRNRDASEDLAQEIVTSLLGDGAPADLELSREAGSGPGGAAGSGKLASYSARGSLAGWLRAAVSHAAVDRFRRARKEVSLEDGPEGATPPEGAIQASPDSADERLDARWGPVFAECVSRAISRLAARDRLLLRLYHLQGISLKLIGSRFGVHEATVSRWLDRARQEVRKGVEQELRKVHGLNHHEVSSLWHWACEAADPRLDILLQSDLVPDRVQKKLQGGTI